MRFATFVLVLSGAAAASGAPAARVGDPTSHGGVIVGPGSANVLIGGQPAARASDFASCPLVTGNVPHVGGPILVGAPTVLINSLPAARAGDQIVENGPPSTIIVGAPTVVIGSSPVQ